MGNFDVYISNWEMIYFCYLELHSGDHIGKKNTKKSWLAIETSTLSETIKSYDVSNSIV